MKILLSAALVPFMAGACALADQEEPDRSRQGREQNLRRAVEERRVRQEAERRRQEPDGDIEQLRRRIHELEAEVTRLRGGQDGPPRDGHRPPGPSEGRRFEGPPPEGRRFEGPPPGPPEGRRFQGPPRDRQERGPGDFEGAGRLRPLFRNPEFRQAFRKFVRQWMQRHRGGDRRPPRRDR